MDIIEKLTCKYKRPRCKTCFKCPCYGCSHDGKTIEEKLNRKVGNPKGTLPGPKRPRNDPAVLSYYEPVADYEYEYESNFQSEDVSS
jgi:hypothetical protein